MDAAAVELVCGLAAADKGVAMGCACGVGYQRMLRLADAMELQSKWMAAAQLVVAAGLLAVNGLRPVLEEGVALRRAAALLKANLEDDAEANALEFRSLQRLIHGGQSADYTADSARLKQLAGRNADSGGGAADEGVVQVGATAFTALQAIWAG